MVRMCVAIALCVGCGRVSFDSQADAKADGPDDVTMMLSAGFTADRSFNSIAQIATFH